MDGATKNLFVSIVTNDLHGVKTAIESGAKINLACDDAILRNETMEDNIFPADNYIINSTGKWNRKWDNYIHHGYAALHVAAIEADANILQYLIDHVADDINDIVTPNGNTALQVAVWRGNLQNLKVILASKRFNLDLKNKFDRAAIHEAIICYKNIEIVKTLVEFGADLFLRDQHGDTASDLAIRQSLPECIHYLVGITISRPINTPHDLLKQQMAIDGLARFKEEDSLDNVGPFEISMIRSERFPLKRPIRWDKPTKDLFFNMMRGDLRGVQSAIKAGAKVDAICTAEEIDTDSRTDNGILFLDNFTYRSPRRKYNKFQEYIDRCYTLLHVAVVEDNSDILGELIRGLRNKELYTVVTADGDTVLHTAARHGQLKNLQTIIWVSEHVQVNIRNNLGNTAVHEVLRFYEIQHKSHRMDIIKRLVDSGADFSIKNNEGWPPTELACRLLGDHPKNHTLQKCTQYFLNRRNPRYDTPFLRKIGVDNPICLQVSNKLSVVAIMRTINSTNPEHAFLIILSLDDVMRVELVINNDDSGFARIKSNGETINNPNEQNIKKVSRDLVNSLFTKNWEYLAWNINKSEFSTLIAAIERDKKFPPRYNMRGDRTLKLTNSQSLENAHNCFTWARKKLLDLNKQEISRELHPEKIDWIAAVPSYYLTTQQTFWTKRNMATHTAIAATGFVAGYCYRAKL